MIQTAAMQLTYIGGDKPPPPARPRRIILEEISVQENKRVTAAQDRSLTPGAYRCLINFLDAAILDLKDELRRAID